MTITEDLRGPALAAVRATDPGENRRICAVKHLRDATGGDLLLRELIAAVDWALTQDADLSRHVTGHDPATGRAQYSFPNGHSASVIPDPRTPLRFEVLTSDPGDAGRGGVTYGRTTEQVEAKLAAVAALPAPEPPTMAWLTVDDNGRVRDDSTITVDGETWPVPERTSKGWRLAPARIGEALKQRGWRMLRDAEDDTSRAGMLGIPVERIEEG